MHCFLSEKIKKIKLFSKDNDKILSCRYLNGGILFSNDSGIIICKRINSSAEEKFSIISNFDGINFNAEKLKEQLLDKFSSNNDFYSENCKNCPDLIYQNNNKKVLPLKFIELEHWKSCFLNCVYCNGEKVDDLAKTYHYDITPVIQEMIDTGIIDKNTKIICSCGDAILHPEFDKLTYFLINYGMKDIEIYSSAQRYCHSVAEAIDKKIAKIIISIDSACPYIYERIKGVNKFDIAISTIRRYLEFDDKSKKRVILRYMLVKGINDNKKEILDWFLMSKGLGIKKLIFDIEDNWYNSSVGKNDSHLKELIEFVNDLSDINGYDIEFTSKVKNVCI